MGGGEKPMGGDDGVAGDVETFGFGLLFDSWERGLVFLFLEFSTHLKSEVPAPEENKKKGRERRRIE